MEGTTEQLEALGAVLDLEELEVVQACEDRQAKVRRLVLVPRLPVGLCPHCLKVCQERHVCHDREVMDLPLGVFATVLVVRLFQYRCPRCDRFFTPKLACLHETAHATERFLSRLAELVKHTDLANAASFLSVAQKTLEHWYYDYVKRQQEQKQRQEQEQQAPQQPVRSLGIDELSLKKDTVSTASC